MSSNYSHKTPWYCKKGSNELYRGYKDRKPFSDLYYCVKCKTTWERISSGSQVHYNHLPTYGLSRVVCRVCKKRGQSAFYPRLNLYKATETN